MNDPIVDEVRKVREEYARQFDYDLKAICRDLKEHQDAGGRRVVSFAKKPEQQQVSETEQ